MSKYRVFSGPYFPVFRPKTGYYGPEKTPYLDTFHAVTNTHCFLHVVSKTSIRWSKLNCICVSSTVIDGNAVVLNTCRLRSNSLLWVVAEAYPSLIQTSKIELFTIIINYF